MCSIVHYTASISEQVSYILLLLLSTVSSSVFLIETKISFLVMLEKLNKNVKIYVYKYEYVLTIYAPMIYTAPFVIFLIHYEGKCKGVGPWKSRFFWAL